ncbi:MAG: SRPBCC domain-containing protein [Sandaracinaceae bacterium]
MSRWVYAAECEIDAPVEEVWAVLLDLDGYADWNPFTPIAKTTLRVGDPIDMRVHMDGYGITISQREHIRAVEEHAKLVWGMEMLLGTVRAERTQTLTKLEDGRTRYRTEDVIEGPLEPLVRVLMGGSIQRGFEGVARGLKERVEGRRMKP